MAVEARHEVVNSEVVDGRLQARLLSIHQDPHAMIPCTLDTTHNAMPTAIVTVWALLVDGLPPQCHPISPPA